MKRQHTPPVSMPRGGEVLSDGVRPLSERSGRDLANPATFARCSACSLGKCQHEPPLFTPEQRAAIDDTISRVYDAFRLSPTDPEPDLTKKVIRALCRKMVRTHAALGMTEEMTREAQLHFYREGRDAFGNPALFR